LCVVDKIVEGGNQLLLAEMVEIGLVLGELELGLFVLDLSDELDGIQVDTFTGIRSQCSLKCFGNLLAKVVANVLRQLDRDAFLSTWPALTPTRTTQLALVDHLESADLWVGVVLLVGRQLRASAQGMKLL
jgi:hypothetical protein